LARVLAKPRRGQTSGNQRERGGFHFTILTVPFIGCGTQGPVTRTVPVIVPSTPTEASTFVWPRQLSARITYSIAPRSTS
jgi:hypothetical protein